MTLVPDPEVTYDNSPQAVAKSANAAALLAHGLALSQSRSDHKVAVVALLSIMNVQMVGRHIDAFLQGMSDLGWTEGQNFELRLAFANGDLQRLDGLAAELVAREVDVIVVAESVLRGSHIGQRLRSQQSCCLCQTPWAMASLPALPSRGATSRA